MKIITIIRAILAFLSWFLPKGKKARKEAYAGKAQKKGDAIHELDEEIRTLTAHHIAAMASDNHGMRYKLERLLAKAYAKRSSLRRKQRHLEGQAS